MAVKIRLKRVGMRNSPVHRIVVADGRSPRDGHNIEELGTYWPLRQEAENYKLNLERAEYWLGVGAQPSDTVRSIIRKARRTAQGLALPEAKPKKEPEPPKEEEAPPAEETAEAPAAEEPKAEEAVVAAETTEETPAAEEPTAAPEEAKTEKETPVEESAPEKAEAEEETPAEETAGAPAAEEENAEDETPAEEAKADEPESDEEKKTDEKPAE
ncbi:MAG: 30S ribosomal protein S16 [Verrucomicrobiales bacterium]|nr:30S ribosomal protein S16 [Verrucomicrobiales bacterium]